MQLYIDIVDRCNSRCKGCPQTYFGKHTDEKMQLELYGQILRKAIMQYSIEVIAFYNWTEPLLHPDLHSFIALTKETNKNIITCISSNLSFKNIAVLSKAIDCGLDLLIVSVSGYSQEMHSKYHVHGNIDRVKDNLKAISDYVSKNMSSTKIEVHYLQFNDNKNDEIMMSNFCKEIGVSFQPKIACYAKGVDNLDNMKRLIYQPNLREQGQYFDLTNESKYLDMINDSPCTQTFDIIAINHKGEVFLCCNRYYFEEYRIGHFLDLSPEELLYYKVIHPECYYCTAQRRPAIAEDFMRLQKSLYMVSRKDSERTKQLSNNGLYYYPEYKAQQGGTISRLLRSLTTWRPIIFLLC